MMFFLRSKFLNFGMVLVIGFLLLVSLVLSSWLSVFNQSMEHLLVLPAIVWTVLTSLLSAAMATVLFALMFKWLPDVQIRWRDVWIGAALTGVLFEAGKTGLAWYLGRESTADAYGSAGAVVLLLLWVYYGSCILLLGAEFTQVYAAANGSDLEPKATAVRVVHDSAQSPPADGGQDAVRPSAQPPPVLPTGSTLNGHSSHWQRFLAPLIQYIEARGLLLSLEAKEAVGQTVTLLIGGAVAVITVLLGWALLAVALVGVLTNYLDWAWVKAVAVTGGGHLIVAVFAVLFVWWRASRGTWFSETINELKKDRLWIKGLPR